MQWYTNLSYYFGKQWVEPVRTGGSGVKDQLITPARPYYSKRKTINKIKPIVRHEMSKFLSNTPNAVAVPATADDEDTRSAYAAEQAWRSISDSQKLEVQYARAAWWMIITGTGFIKNWWDNKAIDKASGEEGAIKFGNITPFHLFIPDLREQEIDDQPFVINAYVKSASWCKQYFGERMTGTSPSQTSTPVLEEGYLNLSAGNAQKDSYTVYETWIKPGATDHLPEGGVVISIDDKLISVTDGFPYDHGMYPFTKFEHIPTGTFYGDSPLVDLNELQKEYNTLRTEISEAGRRMAKPQILAQKGSIVPAKMTNEPGLIIEWLPGFQPPQPMPMTALPDYYLQQQDRVNSDMEEISGAYEASRGQAPAGVTAGTAINFLQEKNNQFYTPQYKSIEQGYERLAQQTVGLFVQYVDLPRKIKTVGADGAFDTMLLSGSDVKNGTDIRVEQGSSIGESQAAKEARVMDMFSVGIIPQDMALKLLEVGGAQKILDIISVAEKKAQRENIKMKNLKAEDLEAHRQQWELEMQMTLMQGAPPMTDEPSEVLPGAAGTEDDEGFEEPQMPEMPPVVKVDSFDLHDVHLETHNKFRMSQEYEALPAEIKAEIDLHCELHEQQKQQADLMNFLAAIPSDGSDGDGPQTMDVETGGAPAEGDPAAMMAGNGAPAPDAGGM